MANYLIIENNKITNVIVADKDFIDIHYPNAVLLPEGETAGIGWTLENGTYKAPDMTLTEEQVNELIQQGVISE